MGTEELAIFETELQRRGRGARLERDRSGAVGGLLEWYRGCAGHVLDEYLTCVPWCADVPKFHFDYIDSFNVNACAFSAKGCGFIGFNGGTIVRFADFFARCLEGDWMFVADECRGHQKRIDVAPVENWPTTAEQYLSLGFAKFPEDPVRQQFMHALLQFALNFILDHELAHIIHGHLGWLEKRGFSDAYVEHVSTSAKSEDPITRQTLEFDADAWAAVRGFNRVLMWSGSWASGKGRGDPVSENIFSSLQRASYVWSLSVYCAIRLFFNEWRPDGANASLCSHPPASLRALSVGATVTTVLVNKGETDLSTIGAMNRALVDAERAVAAITGKDPELNVLVSAHEVGKNVFAMYRSRWAELYHELLPLALSRSLFRPPND